MNLQEKRARTFAGPVRQIHRRLRLWTGDAELRYPRQPAERHIHELDDIDSLSLTDPAELDLAKHLIRYSEAIKSAAADCRPNYLTTYLFDLAQKFSTFYNACPVLIAEPSQRPTRLLLCDLTARTIEHGLENLLGIKVVQQM